MFGIYLREEIFAEFNFADVQFTDKNFAHFDPLASFLVHFDPLFSEKEKKIKISRNLILRIGPKSAKISSLKV